MGSSFSENGSTRGVLINDTAAINSIVVVNDDIYLVLRCFQIPSFKRAVVVVVVVVVVLTLTRIIMSVATGHRLHQ